jgi:hypothetical protein
MLRAIVTLNKQLIDRLGLIGSICFNLVHDARKRGSDCSLAPRWLGVANSPIAANLLDDVATSHEPRE